MIIVIERFWTPTVVTNENGEALEFDSIESARKFCDENLQNGTAVAIN